MARDHFIPASVLGRFSAADTLPTRERALVVGRRGKVFPARAEQFGYVNGLYDVESSGVWLPPGKDDPGSVDEFINGYEPALPPVLDRLAAAERLPLQP